MFYPYSFIGLYFINTPIPVDSFHPGSSIHVVNLLQFPHAISHGVCFSFRMFSHHFHCGWSLLVCDNNLIVYLTASVTTPPNRSSFLCSQTPHQSSLATVPSTLLRLESRRQLFSHKKDQFLPGPGLHLIHTSNIYLISNSSLLQAAVSKQITQSLQYRIRAIPRVADNFPESISLHGGCSFV